MAHFVLGIDIDGILADFNHSYIKRLEAVSGQQCTLAPGEEPPCWYYADKVGFTKDHERKVWEEIKADRRFWASLPPYVEAAPALTILTMAQAEGHDVYFMTNRPGIEARKQTIWWLEQHGAQKPQVLICPEIPDEAQRAVGDPKAKKSSKGIIARGLGITHLIDDKPENCEAVRQDSPGTVVVLRDRRWNRHFHEAAQASGMKIVGCLEEFFDILSAEEDAAHAESR